MSDGVQRERVDLVRLLGEHQGMIRAYAYAITRDFALTDDVAQEVALVAAEQWDQVPRDGGAVYWLKEVARRKALEALRRWRPQRPVLPEDVVAELADAFTPELAREHGGATAVASCLEKLAGDALTVVRARYWNDLTCEEIAERIGRTVKSVYGILARSRTQLEECLARAARAAKEPR
jgi:RNA polymerase sigma-70 factor, ECF subfamily